VGAWIEIYAQISLKLLYIVAPRVGAWIEIGVGEVPRKMDKVAPRVGAWIEISEFYCFVSHFTPVAPRVGAWIEIRETMNWRNEKKLHPAWVHGLK